MVQSFFLSNSFCQKRTISFLSNDSIEIFADLHLRNTEYPYILLFHQENSSRGEFNEIAQKLLNLEYNCLIVDLRVGDENNFVKNKTANHVNKNYSFSDCLKDVESAIDFIFTKTNKPVILFGSGFSASLCLIEAKNNKKVQGVIAFSPGEYLLPQIKTREKLKNYDKRIFVGSRTDEKQYVKELLQPIAGSLVSFSSYDSSKQFKGSLLLNEKNKSNDKFWFDLLLFFKSLNP